MTNSKYLVSSISFDEYENSIKLFEPKIVPVYMEPSCLKFYTNVEYLKVTKGQAICAIFAYPYVYDGEDIVAKRQFRLLPYSSPLFFQAFNTLDKKNIIREIFKFIFKKYDMCYMPLDFNFNDAMAIQSLGGFLEFRSTHMIDTGFKFEALNSKIRNHISHAQKEVEIVIDNDIEKFRFDIAIHGSELEQKQRGEMAKFLVKTGKGFIVSAIHKEKIVAGALIIFDSNTAYLLHSWQFGDTIRGCIPLIITSAISHSFENVGVKQFDFEGSVIDNIDNFFASFDTQLKPYPYIHFAKDREKLKTIVFRSIDIPGRKCEGDDL